MQTKTLFDMVNRFALDERVVGNLLSNEQLNALAIAATEFYAGYAMLSQAQPSTAISIDTIITLSELALIKRLFLLYVERETALQLEASRGLGVDVFGRSVSEVMSEISLYEAELPRLAFFADISTV
jgi:hypothetical protein